MATDTFPESQAINRRRMISAIGAGLGTVAIGTWAACRWIGLDRIVMGSEPKEPPFDDQGYQLYTVVPKDGEFFDGTVIIQLQPQPTFYQWNPPYAAPHAGGVPNHNYVVWAIEEQAEGIAANPAVASVKRRTTQDVVTFGLPTKTGGKLAIMFAPNHRMEGSSGPKNYESRNQILARWRTEFADNRNVKFSLVYTKQPAEYDDLDFISDPGQILIEYSSGKLPQSVLQAVLNHPQTLKVQWGGPFQTMYCPPCGMG